MKTAVCISGKMDFCRESLDSLRQNILDYNDCDLFVHGYQCPQSESLALEIGSEKCLLNHRPVILRSRITFFMLNIPKLISRVYFGCGETSLRVLIL